MDSISRRQLLAVTAAGGLLTWDNGKFEEIDLTKWVKSSPRYLLANNFAGVPETTITRLKQT
jgi:hypothetical protein